ncbi:ATP-dependent helicase [Aliagarivorans taiwanensis]|uniref:ATP-dependent helicase n=1 Tax=Aliagarivorans taiwanensis TaxID=561966 RepID=UPI0003FAB343|nr:ATP-dependent helicase [Aliagarivorans taiwanensis]
MKNGEHQWQTTLPAKPINELLNELNANQLSGATSNARAIRMIAGPGTGKTKTMCSRVCRLISDGVEPRSILAISFTNEATKSFSERVKEDAGYSGHLVALSTFHAIANKFLQRYSGHTFVKDTLGYSEGFFIIDTDDSDKLASEVIKAFPDGIRLALKEAGLTNKALFQQLSKHRAEMTLPSHLLRTTLTRAAKTPADWDTFLKSWFVSIPDVAEEAARARLSRQLKAEPWLKDALVATFWNQYRSKCVSVHGMDFDDIMLNATLMFIKHPEVAEECARQYSHLLVDEYQDVNSVQARWVQALYKANPALNLFIIGDPRQSIYGFRNARVELMLHAERYFGDFQTLELVDNYRSAAGMLATSNVFARTMQGQITDGQLRSPTASSNHALPGDTSWQVFDTDHEEANWVVSDIASQLRAGVAPDDIYVLYRTRSASKCVEKALADTQINFQMIGEMNFYERAEIKDTLALLRVLSRSKDILSWARLADCAIPGVRGLWLREQQAKDRAVSPAQLVQQRINARNKEGIEGFLSMVDECSEVLQFIPGVNWNDYYREINMPNVDASAIREMLSDPEFRAQFEQFCQDEVNFFIDRLCSQWCESIRPHYSKLDERSASRANVELSAEELTQERLDRVRTLFDELGSRVLQRQPLSDIVEDLLLRASPVRDSVSGSVKMMTGHASKGLEASVVYMVGNEEGLWHPNANDANEVDADDEEQSDEQAESARVYYVMSTRAKHRHVYTQARQRLVNGEIRQSKPLSFLAEHFATVDKEPNPQCRIHYHDHGANASSQKTQQQRGQVHASAQRAPSSPNANETSLMRRQRALASEEVAAAGASPGR